MNILAELLDEFINSSSRYKTKLKTREEVEKEIRAERWENFKLKCIVVAVVGGIPGFFIGIGILIGYWIFR